MFRVLEQSFTCISLLKTLSKKVILSYIINLCDNFRSIHIKFLENENEYLPSFGNIRIVIDPQGGERRMKDYQLRKG